MNNLLSKKALCALSVVFTLCSPALAEGPFSLQCTGSNPPPTGQGVIPNYGRIWAYGDQWNNRYIWRHMFWDSAAMMQNLRDHPERTYEPDTKIPVSVSGGSYGWWATDIDDAGYFNSNLPHWYVDTPVLEFNDSEATIGSAHSSDLVPQKMYWFYADLVEGNTWFSPFVLRAQRGRRSPLNFCQWDYAFCVYSCSQAATFETIPASPDRKIPGCWQHEHFRPGISSQISAC